MLANSKTKPSNLPEDEKILYDSLREHGDIILVSTLAHKLTKVHTKLSIALSQSLTAKGYYVENPGKVKRQYVIAGGVLMGLGFLISFANLALVLCGIIILIFGLSMPKRTPLGAEARERILGFKEYLRVAETDRINFTDAPEKSPKVFEKFLPYAIVFGVEKKWAEKFKDVFTEKTRTTWYGGGDALGSVAFADAISKFSSSADSAFASEGGASGGGGSSGGGAGGGGGGSW